MAPRFYLYRHFSPADNVFRTQKKFNSLCLPMLSQVRSGALKYDSRVPIVPHLLSFRPCSVVWRPRRLVLQWGKQALILSYTAGTLRFSPASVHADQGKRFATLSSNWQLGFTSEGCWGLTHNCQGLLWKQKTLSWKADKCLFGKLVHFSASWNSTFPSQDECS